MLIYLFGQTCGVIAWVFFLLSYHAKRENKIILFQLISSILYSVNYFCVGAMTGLAISIFELIKSIGYYKTDKDYYIFFYSLPVYIFIILFSGFHAVVFLAVLGSLIDGYTTLKSKKVIVYGGIISNTLWIIHDAYFMDFAGAFTDLFLVLSNLSIITNGYVKYIRRADVYTVSGSYISKKTINTIDKLDNDILDKEYRWGKEKIEHLTKNEKYSYIFIKDKNKVVGYVNFLNLDKDIYDKMVNSDEFYDSFENKDIISYTKNKKLYLNLNAIVLRDEYDNSDTLDKICRAINKYINSKRKERYYINEICTFAVNDLEVRILESLGFEKIKNITNECFLYRKVI